MWDASWLSINSETPNSERLEKELHGLLPPSLSSGITIIPPPYGADTPWFGAKLVSNVRCIAK